MRRAVDIELDEEMRMKLEKLRKSRMTSVRLVERASIVLMASEGLENIEIAERLNMTRQKVGRWRLRFQEHGLAGIEKDATRPGGFIRISKEKRDEVIRMTLEETPANSTHWSQSTMAKASGLSPATVGRIWKEHGIKPHLTRTFKLSNDPKFVEKLEDIVGLYMNAPENAIVLSCDEKSQMQALDRTQPGLPLKKGRCGTMTHDYKRNGTTTLFAALNTLNGTVISRCMNRHRHQEWIAFLKQIKRSVPDDKEIHIICDNYATHKHPKVQSWLKRNKRFHFHFTPTSASWLNMVERFFRDISENVLKRGVFRSVKELTEAVNAYIANHNKDPKPFIWTASATDILEKVQRGRKTLHKLQSV